MAAGEKTRTQRLRERRLKKAFQKRRAAKAAARAAAKAPPLQREAKEARDKVVKAANTKLAKPARAGGVSFPCFFDVAPLGKFLLP